MVDLDELMKLREAATPGPWSVKIGDFQDYDGYGTVTAPYVDAEGKTICVPFDRGPDDDNDEDDAAYIVASCNAVPELVARIRELEAEIKRRDAYKLAEICNACTDDRFCPYIGPCPFGNKKRGDITPEDWIKRLEVKQ